MWMATGMSSSSASAQYGSIRSSSGARDGKGSALEQATQRVRRRVVPTKLKLDTGNEPKRRRLIPLAHSFRRTAQDAYDVAPLKDSDRLLHERVVVRCIHWLPRRPPWMAASTAWANSSTSSVELNTFGATRTPAGPSHSAAPNGRTKT